MPFRDGRIGDDELAAVVAPTSHLHGGRGESLGCLTGGNDSLTGGAGADRFLLQGSRPYSTFTQAAATADVMTDLAADDAWIGFVDAGRYWSNSEIERLEGGLAILHYRTNNTTLLRLADGGTQFIYRQVSGGTGGGAAGDNNSKGIINIFDLGLPVGGGPNPNPIIHEMGHNWDNWDKTPPTAGLGQENPNLDSFRALSGWRLGPSNNPNYTEVSYCLGRLVVPEFSSIPKELCSHEPTRGLRRLTPRNSR